MAITRRALIELAALAPLLGATMPARAEAATPLIARLIGETRDRPVAARIALISHALKGRPYRAHTLIGGPDRPEQFVVRDDAFDCVTYCEVVLAAALSRDGAGFESMLKRIRYARGEVSWRTRNHYFSEWIDEAVRIGIAHRPPIGPVVRIDRTVDHSPFGRRRVIINALERDAFSGRRRQLASGDIVGFVARRPALDFFHTGFVMFDGQGRWLLRHASQRYGRVVDEPMDTFLAANRVRHIAVLRANDPAALALSR